jgi:adenosylcobinamide-GDP ribazoletransferase
MKAVKNELIYFATALMFFTRIPVPFTVPYSSEIMNKSQKYFAWVGLLVGLINAICIFLLSFLILK